MNNLLYLYPNKKMLTILIDPLTIWKEKSNGLGEDFINLKTYISILQYLLEEIPNNNIIIKVIYPQYLWPTQSNLNPESFIPIHKFRDLSVVNENCINVNKINKFSDLIKEQKSKAVRTYLLKKKKKYLKELDLSKIQKDQVLEILKNTDRNLYEDAKGIYERNVQDLIDLYFEYEVDVILTTNAVLIGEKKKLEKEFKMFLQNPLQLRETIDIFLKGNDIYYKETLGHLSFPLSYYTLTDPHLHKLVKLWNKLEEEKKSNLNNQFRSMIFNRYIFLMYAKDKFNYYIMQKVRLDDSDIKNNVTFIASYHLNNFYYLLTGLLDNIATIIDLYYNLGFYDSKNHLKCSLGHSEFKKKLKIKNLKLYKLIVQQSSWLKDLRLKRHPGAHREVLFFAELYDKENKNLLSDDMIMCRDIKGNFYTFNGINTIEADLKNLNNFLDNFCEVMLNNVD